MFVLKMNVQIMSLSVLLYNVCVCYVYILKMSIKKEKKNLYKKIFNIVLILTFVLSDRLLFDLMFSQCSLMAYIRTVTLIDSLTLSKVQLITTMP